MECWIQLALEIEAVRHGPVARSWEHARVRLAPWLFVCSASIASALCFCAAPSASSSCMVLWQLEFGYSCTVSTTSCNAYVLYPFCRGPIKLHV